MPNIADFSLNNSRLTILFLIFVVVTGVYVYLDYPKQEDPSILIREAVVTAFYPGMSTERVEDLITRKLEEKIREIGEVDEITSDSKTGASIVHVILKDQVYDLEPVWQDLRNKMDDVVPDLPGGTVGPFVEDEYGLTAVATIALWADGFSLAEMRDVARDTRDRLYTLKGIRKVELYGIQEERIYLEFSNSKLSQYGLTPDVISRTLRERNIILPGGKIEVLGQEIIVEPSGNFNQVSEIESVMLPIPGTQEVTPLRDVVKVIRSYVDPPDRPVYFNGRPAIVLSISIMDGVNSVEFGERLNRRIAELEQGLPIGYRFEYATYQPDLVQIAVNGAVNNLLQTLVIVLTVVIVFLGLRTGLIVGSFVPMAMLLGLVVMWFMNIELQRMSIASMIIALGMLVDNGIVVAEDIRTRLAAGQDRRQAVSEAGETLAVPLLTSSLTTILAFAPMLLADGGTGEYTLSLAQVVTIVLLASWFLAMYMTPAMCFWFMKVDVAEAGQSATADPYAGRFYQVYRGLLNTLLAHRFVVLAVLVAAMVLAGFAFRYVVVEFFPAGDRNQFLAYIDLPAGTRSNRTAANVKKISNWLADQKLNPEVESTIAYVGSGGPRFFLSLAPMDPDPHLAFLVVTTRSNDDVQPMVQRMQSYLLEHFPEVRGQVKEMWLGASETGLMEIRISGPEVEVLQEKAEILLEDLRRIPGMVELKQDWENPIWTVEIRVDQDRARRAGLTSQEIADSLSAYLDGKTITDYREGDTVIPVMGRGLESERMDLAHVKALNVYSIQRKVNVPLSQIAEIIPRPELSRIKRFNQERTITVIAKHQTMKAGEIFAALKPTLDQLDLGPGYWYEVGGELENAADAQGYLVAWMPACFLLIIVLLVWQFNSFRRAGIILMTIPLTFIGAVVGLLVMNAVFGFMVILGLLSLAGIIINNGIVLIDRIEIERAGGRDGLDAVITAALARFRPILMTTLTTILGLLPLILSRDPLFYGMACVIAFGLLVGTFLTLGVVPIFYTLLMRIPVSVGR